MQHQHKTAAADVELSADGKTPLWDRDPDGPYRYVSTQDRDRRARYGLRVDQFQAIIEEQGDACYLCKKPWKARQTQCVDHDHETFEVLGVAHHGCNLKRRVVPADPPARRIGPFFVPESCRRRHESRTRQVKTRGEERRPKTTDADAQREARREELRAWHAAIREGTTEAQRRHTAIVMASVRELCAWFAEEEQVAGFVEADAIKAQAGVVLRRPQYRDVRIDELKRTWLRTPQGHAWLVEARMRRMPSNGSPGRPMAIDPSGRTGTPGGLRQAAARWAHRMIRRPHD